MTPIGDKSAVSPIDIKAVKEGAGYKLTMSFQKGVSSSPVELGKGAMSPSAVIQVGGAEKATVAVTGPSNPEAVPANTPHQDHRPVRHLHPEEERQGHLHRGRAHHQGAGHHHHLHPRQRPGALPGAGRHRIRWSPPRRPEPPRPPEALPQTGPTDSALALGTLGATVLLTGAAGVLWLTRRGGRARS
ncbi:hypothetical protein GCM10020254_51230 [Streptomyces goshikiensis]